MSKKKILLLSDDLRMQSGIATVSRQLVTGTVDKFDWVQLGAAIKHPDQGKVIDISEAIQAETKVEDASVKIYPSNGYGNAEVLRNIIHLEKPDAVLHFTDPRYWIWLYECAHEIREIVPLMFYHIWDDLPDPMYNRDYYESCDWIGCISRQTYGIVNRVWGSDRQEQWKQFEDWQVSYVPHGINRDWYFKITSDKDKKAVEELRDKLSRQSGKQKEFVVLWANRNIRRKMPGDVILAFKHFCDQLPKEEADKCVLLMHTTPVDNNGTDLLAVKDELCSDYDVLFSNTGIDTGNLNLIHNLADVTINIANNEGFGLTTCESVMAETPIVVNVTGGLQDQCGFKVNGKELTADDYIEIGSLHDYKKWEGKVEHGEWVKPVFPRVRSLNGSPPTPYIFDDRVHYEDAGNALLEWYNTPKEEREAAGKAGREWLINGTLNQKYMCQCLVDGVEATLENYKPLERFKLYKV